MKETLAESAPAYSATAKWRGEFIRGQLSCDNLHQCGQLATSINEETVQNVNKLVTNNQ